jgi:type II secretory pathway pseudopilin PulG
MTMRKQQRGLSLIALIFGLFVVIILAIFAMKVVPSFLEFRSAKSAIEAIAKQAQSPTDVRRAWEGRAAIDDIRAIQASDLEVSKEGNEFVIAFAYRKEVPLVGPVGLYINYAASSKGAP